MGVCPSLTSPGVQGERQWQFIPEVVTFNRNPLPVSRSVADKNHSESRVGMEAHHSLDDTGNFRVGGEEREKQRGRKKGEQRKRGRKNMTHPPCKYT